jgi:hypothetical protein
MMKAIQQDARDFGRGQRIGSRFLAGKLILRCGYYRVNVALLSPENGSTAATSGVRFLQRSDF